MDAKGLGGSWEGSGEGETDRWQCCEGGGDGGRKGNGENKGKEEEGFRRWI